jgi:hypothetical protein
VENMAIEFCTRLFTTQDETSLEMITQFVQPKVSTQMNERLDAPFSDLEIENALFMMYPNKSLGLDGFTAGFYVKHWDLIKEDVCAAV